MPKYNLRLGNSKVTIASTNQPISSRFLDRGKPQTVTDQGGTIGNYSFEGQELDRSELRKVKQIREKGGLVAWLFEAKSLMKFGTGADLQSENDDLQEWLDDNFGRVDLTTLDLGQDAVFYPYGLGEVVETRGGEFSHIELIEPWTMLPQTNEYGEILQWEQETQDGTTQPFAPEEIGSIVLNKSSGRDKVGVSEVLRSEEEITQYKENQRAVNKAIEVAGFPHHVWTVGSEGRSPVDDNDLRRVRNLIDNMDGDTQFVVGPDVEHDKITPSDFDFEGVTRRDLRMLTTTVGLPLEMAGYGREGMGSGSETDLIGDLLALQNEVSRRRFETQFVAEFVEPVVDQYSPFDAESEPIEMHIAPFLDERKDVASLIEKIGDYMSNEEIRDRLDLPPLEDDEIADAYRTPKEIEEAEEAPEDAGGGGFGDAGFFSSSNMRRVMQEVPDNAVSITDPSEAPEDANVIEGPGGGLYYVPGGGAGGGGDDGGEGANVRSEEPPDSVDLSNEEDSQTLEDAGIVDGSNHEDMRISQLEDGSEVFVRENTSDLDADSIAAGYSVYKQAGIEIPDHHIDEDGTLAKEGVSGSTLRSQNFDPDNVDEDSLIDAYAGVMLAGDTDMHGANMMVRDDGTVVPVDIAGSGGVLSPEDHQNKIESQLDTLGADVEFEEIVNRAEELAGDIDPEQIPEGGEWDMMKDNITERVEEMA